MCEAIYIDGKYAGIVCGMRRAKPQPCNFCAQPSTKQCDYPVDGKTCDVHMCDACSVSVGNDLDHCIGHARLGKRYRVIEGSHAGHLMLLLAWRLMPKRPGVRQREWRYASQCSCLKAGELAPSHLRLLDLTAPVLEEAS